VAGIPVVAHHRTWKVAADIPKVAEGKIES
jgi:hypothetical protein